MNFFFSASLEKKKNFHDFYTTNFDQCKAKNNSMENKQKDKTSRKRGDRGEHAKCGQGGKTHQQYALAVRTKTFKLLANKDKQNENNCIINTKVLRVLVLPWLMPGENIAFKMYLQY